MTRAKRNELERTLLKAVWDAVQAFPESHGRMTPQRVEPIKAYVSAIVDVLAEDAA
jgi:hypothetical protein